MHPLHHRLVMRALGLTLLLLTGLVAINPAHAALEAVELTNVPTDILASCNRSFFASSNVEERALYVTPHVVAGRSPLAGGEKEVFIDPKEEGGLPHGHWYLFSS